MTARCQHGLVVGKFSPLHRGHEFLIERARSACERLTVLSYCNPEFPRCGAALRRAWLRHRAPGVTVVVFDQDELARRCRIRGVLPRPIPPNDAHDDVQREFAAWVCLDVLRISVDAVFTSEGYGEGFAAHLARAFAQRDVTHAGVTHHLVDGDRRCWPVSGTAVRMAPGQWRGQVDPFVFADLVPRICVLGGESSGKTTLAHALAEALGGALVPEFGRAYWEQLRQDLSLSDLDTVARTQVEQEVQMAQTSPPCLVCDTSPLTTLVYALLDHGRPLRPLVRPLVRLSRRPYDLTVLCQPDFPFVQDGTRRDAAWRASQHELTLKLLRRRGQDFLQVTGTVSQRLDQVLPRLPDWNPAARGVA